ncbi:MAG: hypothetical protein ACXU8N_12530 [Telluria sp.]
MRHHLKAVFNDQAEAERVLASLSVSGYPPHTFELSSPPDAASALAPFDPGLGGLARKLAARWFTGAAPPPADERTFLPGRHVVTVDVATEPACAGAIALLEQSNAIYIEDWREAVALPARGEGPEPARPRSFTYAAYPAGTAPGTLQHRHLDGMPLFGTQDAGAPFPHGTTYQESLDVPADEPDADADRP